MDTFRVDNVRDEEARHCCDIRHIPAGETTLDTACHPDQFNRHQAKQQATNSTTHQRTRGFHARRLTRKVVNFSEPTRIPTRQCVEQDELRLMLQREQQQRDEMRAMRSSPVCPSGPGCRLAWSFRRRKFLGGRRFVSYTSQGERAVCSGIADLQLRCAYDLHAEKCIPTNPVATG